MYKGKIVYSQDGYIYIILYYIYMYVCMYVCMHVCMHVYIYMLSWRKVGWLSEGVRERIVAEKERDAGAAVKGVG